MLVGRDRGRFRVTEAIFWSATWGVGAAIGVALGGWLTVVGGSGAPGAGGLDAWTDLVVLPALTFAVVFAVHLCGQLFAATVRGGARDRGHQEQREKRGTNDEVVGEIRGQ
jgi:hypothetical protein